MVRSGRGVPQEMGRRRARRFRGRALRRRSSGSGGRAGSALRSLENYVTPMTGSNSARMHGPTPFTILRTMTNRQVADWTPEAWAKAQRPARRAA